MKIIDLTLPARHGDGRFGQENQFLPEPHTFEQHGLQSSTFRMFAHFGTHVDAPRHFLPDGRTIDEVPLDRLIGRGTVFDLSDSPPNAAIGESELAKKDPGLIEGDIAVLRTGWTDQHWGTGHFLENAPFLDEDGANWLVEKNVKAVVYDFPEEYLIRTQGFRGESCTIHHTILGNDIYNIEYVINLRRLEKSFYTIMALPLNLVGMDGAPARVIALDNYDTTGQLACK
jgi:arylformamidase